MKALTLFLALSLCAAAQTTTNVQTVTLSGSVADPTLENHSGKTVIGAFVALTDGAGVVWRGQRLFIHDSLGIPDGGAEKVGLFSKYQKLTSPIVSAKILAVIFSDGEFRGEDSYDLQANMGKHLQGTRHTWEMAKAGNWAGIKAQADKDFLNDDDVDIFVITLAKRLMLARSKYGDAATVDSLAQYGLLPTSTWKGGLINRLRIPQIPNAFQAMVARVP